MICLIAFVWPYCAYIRQGNSNSLYDIIKLKRNFRNHSRKIWVCECSVCVTIVHRYSQEDAEEFIREHNLHANSEMRIGFEIIYSGDSYSPPLARK